jgi:prolyl-tRNA editing enzyme YbaK/EbsC (Cys-tRNA(Pro) deacylase)
MTLSDPIAGRVVAHLERLGAPYELIDCDPDLADTAAFCAHYGYPMDRSANTILVASRRPEGSLALCVVLADDRLDVNGTVRRRLGVRKVSFAPPELTMQVTGMAIGGVTPFGVSPDLAVWVDPRVMALDWVILGGGSRAYKISVDPKVFAAMGNAEVVEGLTLQS